jgi:L-ascorbate metabolism protein UlaG (beta-lactamase superfamily)
VAPIGTADDANSVRPPAWCVTWYGHATAVLEAGGRRVLCDPLGRARARRAAAAAPLDAVVITHSHVDHLNRWTLKALDRSLTLVVPRGAAPVVADLGFARVVEMVPGDHLDLGGADLVAVPTRHDNGRWSKRDAPVCAGYVLARDGAALHHAGDVDVSDHAVFDDIGKQFRLDATLLPIGGMLPVWYYRMRREVLDRGVHIDPDAALRIAERLGAAAMVPVHWGTVNLRLGPPSMPRRRLVKVAAERGLDRLVRVLDHGARLSAEMVEERAGQREDDAAEADDRSEDAIADGGIA